MITRTDRNQTFDADGNLISEQVVEVDVTAEVNEATLRQQAQDSLDTLRTSIDTLKAISDKTNAEIGPRDTKDVARECRRIARQTLALSRLILRALDSADVGTE